MANYVDYIKSISYEIKAVQDKVKHFVKHYGEDGCAGKEESKIKDIEIIGGG